MEMVVVCRCYKPGTLNDLAPGNLLGYSCVLCSQALQVSVRGVASLKAGGRPFCNQCASRFIYIVGPQNLAGVIVSPQAQEQMDIMIQQVRDKRKKASA